MTQAPILTHSINIKSYLVLKHSRVQKNILVLSSNKHSIQIKHIKRRPSDTVDSSSKLQNIGKRQEHTHSTTKKTDGHCWWWGRPYNNKKIIPWCCILRDLCIAWNPTPAICGNRAKVVSPQTMDATDTCIINVGPVDGKQHLVAVVVM